MKFNRRIRTGFLTRLALIACAMAFMAKPMMNGLGHVNPFDPLNSTGKAYKETVTLSDTALHHILEGDSHGGGHRHGQGAACKSEFPAGWDDAKIATVIRSAANNNSMGWKKADNGYYTADTFVDGLRLRIVTDREGDDVVTAYPLDTPRNPCPARAPANDNHAD